LSFEGKQFKPSSPPDCSAFIDSEPGVVYPRVIEATGQCAPEDVGGPWGYAELIAAIDDPKHERHA
jgi:pRiA4b ORF-3-like protein